jgi:hypothetical protein
MFIALDTHEVSGLLQTLSDQSRQVARMQTQLVESDAEQLIDGGFEEEKEARAP